jgi:hypothetical protein
MPVDPQRTPLAERPAAAGTALLVIDMFSDWDFPDADALAPAAARVARCSGRLKQRCDKAGVPTVFVKDNHGPWRSDAPAIEARVRDYDVVAPTDCVGSQTIRRNAAALRCMKQAHKVATPRSRGLRIVAD